MSPRTAESTASRIAIPKLPLNIRKPDRDVELEVAARPRRWMGIVAPMALATVLATLLLMAVFHALIVQGQRELDRLANDVGSAEVENDRLLLELAQKEAPARIVASARAFGMVDAPEVHYLAPADNPVGVIGTVAGDSQP